MISYKILEVATVWGISIGGVVVVVLAGVRFLSEWKSRREISKRLEQVMMDLKAGQVLQ